MTLQISELGSLSQVISKRHRQLCNGLDVALSLEDRVVRVISNLLRKGCSENKHGYPFGLT